MIPRGEENGIMSALKVGLTALSTWLLHVHRTGTMGLVVQASGVTVQYHPYARFPDNMHTISNRSVVAEVRVKGPSCFLVEGLMLSCSQHAVLASQFRSGERGLQN